jgi:hypothetical protein
MYISLGGSCATIHQIIEHVGKNETLFFDWLVSNKFSDVLFILDNYSNIKDILNKNSITILEPVRGKTKIKFLEECYSLHDVPDNYTDRNIESFLKKYKRRLLRIIHFIKNNQETIFFLRSSENSTSKLQKNKFHESIYNINNNLNYFLVDISYSNKFHNTIEYEDKCCSINLKENNSNKDWTLNHLDWKFAFDSIKEIKDGKYKN